MDQTAWGIVHGYHDVEGNWHATPPATVRAFLGAMGAEAEQPPPAPVRVVPAGTQLKLSAPAELETEDGGLLRAESVLPPDLPPGYHRLTPLDGSPPVRLIVGVGRCHLPEGLHTWGWAVQLPTLRSSESWGMGDLGDLRRLAAWSSRDLGAGTLLLNPLHAARLGLPQEASPYSPSSRRYRNLLYLRIEEVPGFDSSLAEVGELAQSARALNHSSIIERDPIYEAKLAALERLWERFAGDEDFDRYRRDEGESLLGYATFCLLDEQRRLAVRDPKAPLPHPKSQEVARLQREQADRIGFHMWVQWLIDQQLAKAGTELALMQDLAVGFDPDGADAWQYQDEVVAEARVGAPPDDFNRNGQDWGLPPFDPWRLRAAGYEPFVQTVRNGFRHAGGLRVDHVMGLFRLFWVPLGEPASLGGYVRYPWQDLLEILALESHRAKAYVVGEDLGTVEDEVRRELAARNILSYRLLWFEPDPPSAYPERALSAVSTHDLPTIAGVWTGADVEDQRKAGLEPNEDGAQAMRARLEEFTGVAETTPVDEVVARAYEALAQAPSALICATVEDVVAAEARPNLPGTTSDVRPNWSIPLSSTLEQLEADPRARRLASILARDATVAT